MPRWSDIFLICQTTELTKFSGTFFRLIIFQNNVFFSSVFPSDGFFVWWFFRLKGFQSYGLSFWWFSVWWFFSSIVFQFNDISFWRFFSSNDGSDGLRLIIFPYEVFPSDNLSNEWSSRLTIRTSERPSDSFPFNNLSIEWSSCRTICTFDSSSDSFPSNSIFIVLI